MKKSHRVTMIGIAIAFAILTVSSANAQSTGFVNQHQIDQSGVKGTLVFLDSDMGLEVMGVATGLDPLLFYVTLLYDLGSVPSGPRACVPSPAAPVLPMFVGSWFVNADGTGTLGAHIDADLAEVGAASIRISTGVPPGILVACGRVHED